MKGKIVINMMLRGETPVCREVMGQEGVMWTRGNFLFDTPPATTHHINVKSNGHKFPTSPAHISKQ